LKKNKLPQNLYIILRERNISNQVRIYKTASQMSTVVLSIVIKKEDNNAKKIYKSVFTFYSVLFLFRKDGQAGADYNT